MIRIFRVFFPASAITLVISEFILLFTCYLLASFLVLDVDPEFFLLYEDGLFRIAIVVATIMLALYFHDLYTELRVRRRTLLVQQICMCLGIAFLGQAAVGYAQRELILPRWTMIIGSLFVLVLLPGYRVLYAQVVLRAMGFQQLLLIGTSPLLEEVAERFDSKPEMGFTPIGFLDDSGGSRAVKGVERLGSLADLREVVAQKKPDRIVVGMLERRQKLPVHDLLDLRLSGIHIEEVAHTYETAFGRICTRELRPSQLVFSTELGPSAGSVASQRIYSTAIAAGLFVITMPIMLIVALMVRLTSKGPILYRQTRVGMDGRKFQVMKFRSMRVDAEAATGAVWAKKDDPRITPIGKFLRKSRLDELPQLLNVLRGEMSMVGPRPERPEFVQTLSERIPFYRQRLCVPPGLTGWAQINHKYGDTIEDTIVKLEYDLYYIKHLSFSLDIYIILNTLKTVVLGRGAQ